MAEKKKRGGKWKPGESGNPKGRPPLPPDVRAIQNLSPAYVKRVIAKLARMDRDELKEWLENPDRTAKPNNLEMMLASIIVKATAEGDHSKLSFLLDRSIGKVIEERKVQVQPVKYITKVRADGALLQEVVFEALEEDK